MRHGWLAGRSTAAQAGGARQAAATGVEAAARELRRNRPFDALLVMQKESGVQTARHQAIRAEAYARLGACTLARRWMGSLPDRDPVRATVGSRCHAAAESSSSSSADLLARLDSPRLRPYGERPLSEAQRRPANGEPESPVTRYPSLRASLVVTISPEAGQMFAVSISSDVDPRAEISFGGYWLHVSGDHGRQWQGPYYLGLAHQYPYVIERAARGVVFDGVRALLEVERREVDESSITLPPIELRTKGVVERLLLDVDLSEVRRDTDGDGLTDLLEEKLLSNPSDRDTDADGIPDGRDAVPLLRQGANALPEIVRLWERLLPRLFGGPEPIQHIAGEPGARTAMVRIPQLFQSNRTLFVVGAPCPIPYSAGVRGICFDSDTFDRYERKFGDHFPLILPEIVFDSRRRRALIHYDFGWTGGTILATWKRGDWQLQDLSTFVT